MAQPLQQYRHVGQHGYPQPIQQPYPQQVQYPSYSNGQSQQYPQHTVGSHYMQPYPPYQQHFSNQNQQSWQGQYHYQNGIHGQVPNAHPIYPQQQYHQQPSPSDPYQNDRETCFNCGHPDHFAQNCPEPRREVPVGQIKRQKRLQHRKSYPNANSMPHLQSLHTPQPPYSQMPHPQSFAAHSAPPVAHSNPAHYWQYQHVARDQAQHTYQDHQQSQLLPQPSHSPPNSAHFQYPNHGTPVPASPWPNSIQRPESQASHTPSNPGHAVRTPQSWPGTAPETSTLESNTAGMDAQDSKEEADSPQEDVEEDDLTALDIPDVPEASTCHEYGVQLVGRPLPSNFIVADALYPLAPPGPQDADKCSSKYFEHTSEERALESIHTSNMWKDRREDTMFRSDLEDTTLVPLGECLARVAARRIPGSNEESQHKSRTNSHVAPPRSAEAVEMAESLERVERALAEAKQMIANKTCKPKIKTEVQPEQHLEASKTYQASPSAHDKGDAWSPCSGENHHNAPNGLRSHSQGSPNVPHGPPQRDSVKSFSKPVSRNHVQRTNSRGNGSTHHSFQHRRPHNGVPPPPPPPPSESISPTDLSASYDDHGRGRHDSGVPHGTAHPHWPAERPSNPNRATSSYERKRHFEQRIEESSSEEDDSPRRQEDDITPKHKRRQPIVAEAYSRRW